MNTFSNLVYLVPLFPIIGFLITGLGRNIFSKTILGIIGSGVILASFAVSVGIFLEVKQPGFTALTVHLFEFINTPSFNIPFAFQVDQLSSLFLLIITGVGFLIHVYSTAYMKTEETKHYGRYFSYLNLFVISMLLLVLGSNYVIMFIGWEGVGLCSYLLIGYWFKNNNFNYAARKAFVMNRIGDLGFLLGIFWIISKIGTVTFSEIFAQTEAFTAFDITCITLLFFVGAAGKSAQIPLYTWLPDAMAGPTPVSALIHAATMVTAGIYMIVRSNALYSLAPVTQGIIAIIGTATILLAATIAIKQNDIKKVLAYSTVSQLGYMFLALGVGSYTGAVFHVMTHAFFKALLFLGAGSVIHAMHHEQDIRFMGGLKKHMPITHITFLLGCLAIAGMPPFSGFFSKDEILAATYASDNQILWGFGVIGAILTAFYMFRLYAMTFLGKFRGTPEQEKHLHESPSAITIPLIILAVLSVVGGFLGIPEVFAANAHSLQQFLDPIIVKTTPLEVLDHTTEYMLMGISVGFALIAIIYACNRFSRRPEIEEHTGAAKVLANRWYVDELYDIIISKPLMWLAAVLKNVVEKGVIDGIVNGTGRIIQYSGRQIRHMQSGLVGNYILLMVLSMVLMILLLFYGHNMNPVINWIFN
jgi:NADH-quinone oxidoreductase subunit L